MKIALDPYMFRALPMQEMVRTVADLGYSYIELSPREEFMPFFLHPRGGRPEGRRTEERVAGDWRPALQCPATLQVV